MLDKLEVKVLHGLAHMICGAKHPEFQMGCTGWMSLDGTFLVSCATCKAEASQIIKDATE